MENARGAKALRERERTRERDKCFFRFTLSVLTFSRVISSKHIGLLLHFFVLLLFLVFT